LGIGAVDGGAIGTIGRADMRDLATGIAREWDLQCEVLWMLLIRAAKWGGRRGDWVKRQTVPMGRGLLVFPFLEQ
jgi:hypothetical protein